ncbi:MAG: hypothetical protein JWO96_554 [Candidatus Saccharibacteria bacterium]|nr:hypothetical protein [Candidatus Saccharibacteria bacterium]
MARKKRSSDDYLRSSVDVFEAVKLALMRRGLVRQRSRRKTNPTPEKASTELEEVTRKSHDILFTTNTIFPFTLFPDTVTLDREKLTIAKRIFFRVARLTSTPIRDILSVEAHVGPFFGSLHMSSRYFITNPYSVNFLLRKDALELQRLLQGYIIVHEQQINCGGIKKPELIALLNDLGKGDTG